MYSSDENSESDDSDSIVISESTSSFDDSSISSIIDDDSDFEDLRFMNEDGTVNKNALMNEFNRFIDISTIPKNYYDNYTKYFNKEVTSCTHYNSNCKIIAPCCGKTYDCWRCHNEKETHQLEFDKRNEIMRIVCKKCNKEQKVSNLCENLDCCCTFGKYYCRKCRMFDNERPFHHCDKCGYCITGKAEDCEHCDKCGYCIPKIKGKIDKHLCVKGSVERNCPICLDVLKSTTQLIILKCGHAIHEICLVEYLKSSYKCPECLVTIKDMTKEWRKLDKEIENTPLSGELAHNIIIHCNDCGKNSRTFFHYEGSKCTKCGSYNTYKK